MICRGATAAQGSKSRYFNAPRGEVRISLFCLCQIVPRCLKLREYMAITRSHGLRLPTAAHDRLIASYLCFLRAREPAGIPRKPKVHLAVHLVLSAGRFGNPRLLGFWIDESDNRKLSLVASTAVAPIWHRRILSTVAHEADPSASSTKSQHKNTSTH